MTLALLTAIDALLAIALALTGAALHRRPRHDPRAAGTWIGDRLITSRPLEAGDHAIARLSDLPPGLRRRLTLEGAGATFTPPGPRCADRTCSHRYHVRRIDGDLITVVYMPLARSTAAP